MYDYQNSIEEWMPIPEFPNYSVSYAGRVRNDDYDRPITPARTSNGGLYVGMSKGGRQYKRYLPLLVADAFVDAQTGYEPDLEYNTPLHIDGDKMNCRASNLIWATRTQAILHHKVTKG